VFGLEMRLTDGSNVYVIVMEINRQLFYGMWLGEWYGGRPIADNNRYTTVVNIMGRVTTKQWTSFTALTSTATTMTAEQLSNSIANVDTIDTFKNRFDKYWSNQDVLFNSNADLIGTGSLPICM